MKKLLVLFAITVCSTSQSVFGQDPESKDDKLSELIERQRAIRVSISAGGGSNFGPVKESFKVGEPITIVVFMTNTGNETVGVEISDPYYQNRPTLMKGGQEVRYRQKVVEILKWKDDQGCGAGRSFIAELEPNRQSEADFLVINEGLRVTHNIVWYDLLEPGKYELTIRRRFGCFKGPEAESNTIYFEVVADQASHNKRLQPTP